MIGSTSTSVTRDGLGASWVRVSGAINADGTHSILNGDYTRTDKMVNGRPVYSKVGKSGTSMWYYDVNDQWMVGPANREGTDACWAYSDAPAAEGGPERTDAPWTFYSFDTKEWVRQEMVSIKDVDDPVRPGIIQRLCELRAESTIKKPREFDVFQLHVQENNMQLARFDFLQLKSYFEGLQIGPSNPGVPMQGATALEMIFKYYAARRQFQVEGGSFKTFDDIQEANNTMDMAELTKFMKEFLPGIFNRKEINWLFKMANLMDHGLSDEAVFTMDFDEFAGILCQIAMQLFRGDTPKMMARKLGLKLGLSDPLKMRAKIRQMGRIDAGFGAWKSDEASSAPMRFDANVRFHGMRDASKYVLDHHEFTVLKNELLNGFPDVKIPEWMPFPGPFIAFVFPAKGVRADKNIRFKVVLRNVAPRAIQLYPRLIDLPNVSMTQSGEKCSIAPGMEITLVIIVDNAVSGCQVGGIIFSAEESGPEIFRCPIFLRSTNADKDVIGHNICAEIAKDVDISDMRSKFQSLDSDNSGRVSVDIFQKVVSDLGYELEPEQKKELQKQTELEKVDNEITVDYDDFIESMCTLKKRPPKESKEESKKTPGRTASESSVQSTLESPKIKSPSKGGKGKMSKTIRNPPRKLLDSMESKIADTGFAIPLTLEHAVPMAELNQQLRYFLFVRHAFCVYV
jgi:Ca2+-binding EF-hand superfamily protein